MRPEKSTSRLALLSLLAILALGQAGSAMAEEPATFADALAQAAEQNKILVVDFMTDW